MARPPFPGIVKGRRVTTGSGRRRFVPLVSVLPIWARPYQRRRAGVVSRLLANTLDFVVLLAMLGGTYLAVAAVRLLLQPTSFRFPGVSWPLATGLAIFYSIIYLTFCWSTTGRTYGDHVLGLRVVNVRGDRMRVPGALIRAAFCVFLPVGVLWSAVSGSNRSVQDIVLRTSVIYDWGTLVSDLPRS